MKPSVKETGQTQVINGMTAREVILTIEFEGTDPKTNQKATMMTVTSDMWLAPNVAGYQEVQSFYQRMAQKLAWTPGMSAMMTGQQSKGMAALYQEAAKLSGVPVRQITKMGFSGAGAGEGEAGEAQAQQQPERQQQAESEKPSLGGALGRLSGGRLGGLGGRRKTEQTSEQQTTSRGEQRSEQQRGPASMMEMTSDLSGFSSAPADASKFEIPAGFKQVDSPLLKMR